MKTTWPCPRACQSLSSFRFSAVALLLLAGAQPAWALGDYIVPQAIGVLLGGPVLLLLLGALIWVGTRRSAASRPEKLRPQEKWTGTALLGGLFNACWFGLLVVFDPGTWNQTGSWTGAGFTLGYILPSAVMAFLWILADHARRAGALVASCLLVGLGYWLLVAMPAEVSYAIERKQARARELAAAPDGSRQKPYSEVEEMPLYPGGPAAMEAAIQLALRYPKPALKQGFEGSVRVSYTVLPDGSLADVQAEPSAGKDCSAEAERVIHSLPRFQPGRQHGVAVAVTSRVNVLFILPAEVVHQREEQAALKEWEGH